MPRVKTRAEERWERMQELLAREAAGHDGPMKISSQRTLFGIKSHVEEVIERVAAEDEQRCLDALDETTGSSNPTSNSSANLASTESSNPTSNSSANSVSAPSSGANPASAPNLNLTSTQSKPQAQNQK